VNHGGLGTLRTVVRWIVFIAVPVSTWPLLSWLHAPPEMSRNVLVLSSAQAVAETGRRGITPLPDDWRAERIGAIEKWYEFRFRAEPEEYEHWAVYLPAQRMNAAVYLNGALLGDGGRFEEPVSRNWSRPLFFPFTRSLLAADVDTLRIRVRSDLPDAGFLAPVLVGPHRELWRHYAHRYALKITTVWAIMLSLVTAAIFTAAIWTQWREEESYSWFAAATLSWAALCLNVVIVDIPVGTMIWYGLWHISAICWAGFLTRFLLAFVGDRNRFAARALEVATALGAAVVAVLAALGSAWLFTFTRAWLALFLVGGIYATDRVIRLLLAQDEHPEIALPNVLGACVIPCALHDWLVFAKLAVPSEDFYLPYAALPVIAGMGWALLRRFVGALRESESLVASLERRVQSKRDELERSYARLREVERSRVVASERERLLREMHDGLGSHLVSTLSLIESHAASRESIGQAIHEAIDDLRLMVESLEPLEGELLNALAMLRARMLPRLEAAGIRMDWNVADLPSLPDLRAGRVLQVLRIVQEALTNALKHACATTITVSTGATATDGSGSIFVEIADDGRGFAEAGRKGRGLDHMRRRARDIGADLTIRATAGGTCVRLEIPIVETSDA